MTVGAERARMADAGHPEDGWREASPWYQWGPYLSPFYSPLIDIHHKYWPYSPALLILGGPLGFRATCYYYRKALYRAFLLDPGACAVPERKRNYSGEMKFPFILQNLHRYFLYLAVVFIAFLWHDAIRSFFFFGGFGIGVGTLVLVVNVTLLSLYLLSCHSLRHLVGGALDVMSGRPVRKTAFECVSCLNRWHMNWAWTSLLWVGFTDFYVRMCAMGVWTDWRIL
jgi:hypothetical protein